MEEKLPQSQACCCRHFMQSARTDVAMWYAKIRSHWTSEMLKRAVRIHQARATAKPIAQIDWGTLGRMVVTGVTMAAGVYRIIQNETQQFLKELEFELLCLKSDLVCFQSESSSEQTAHPCLDKIQKFEEYSRFLPPRGPCPTLAINDRLVSVTAEDQASV